MPESKIPGASRPHLFLSATTLTGSLQPPPPAQTAYCRRSPSPPLKSSRYLPYNLYFLQVKSGKVSANSSNPKPAISSDDLMDKLLLYNNTGSSLRIIPSGQVLRTDGIHRLVKRLAISELCPNGLRILDAIRKTGLNSSPICLGKEIFVSTQSPHAGMFNKYGPKKCGLEACRNIIFTGDDISFCSILHPENHIYSRFPFKPASDFPSKLGLLVCKFHCLISHDPTSAPYLESQVFLLFG